MSWASQKVVPLFRVGLVEEENTTVKEQTKFNLNAIFRKTKMDKLGAYVNLKEFSRSLYAIIPTSAGLRMVDRHYAQVGFFRNHGDRWVDLPTFLPPNLKIEDLFPAAYNVQYDQAGIPRVMLYTSACHPKDSKKFMREYLARVELVKQIVNKARAEWFEQVRA